MSDPVMLEFVKNIDARTARMEDTLNTKVTKLDTRVVALETTHTAVKFAAKVAFRVVVFMSLVGGAGGLAKSAGLVDKLLTSVGGNP